MNRKYTLVKHRSGDLYKAASMCLSHGVFNPKFYLSAEPDAFVLAILTFSLLAIIFIMI